MTDDRKNSDNPDSEASATVSALPEDGLNAIVRFLARRAAERDYAQFLRDQRVLPPDQKHKEVER